MKENNTWWQDDDKEKDKYNWWQKPYIIEQNEVGCEKCMKFASNHNCTNKKIK